MDGVLSELISVLEKHPAYRPFELLYTKRWNDSNGIYKSHLLQHHTAVIAAEHLEATLGGVLARRLDQVARVQPPSGGAAQADE